jgi:hypothetical protein
MERHQQLTPFKHGSARRRTEILYLDFAGAARAGDPAGGLKRDEEGYGVSARRRVAKVAAEGSTILDLGAADK